MSHIFTVLLIIGTIIFLFVGFDIVIAIWLIILQAIDKIKYPRRFLINIQRIERKWDTLKILFAVLILVGMSFLFMWAITYLFFLFL